MACYTGATPLLPASRDRGLWNCKDFRFALCAPSPHFRCRVAACSSSKRPFTFALVLREEVRCSESCRGRRKVGLLPSRGWSRPIACFKSLLASAPSVSHCKGLHVSKQGLSSIQGTKNVYLINLTCITALNTDIGPVTLQNQVKAVSDTRSATARSRKCPDNYHDASNIALCQCPTRGGKQRIVQCGQTSFGFPPCWS